MAALEGKVVSAVAALKAAADDQSADIIDRINGMVSNLVSPMTPLSKSRLSL